jgi:hypothetical protein
MTLGGPSAVIAVMGRLMAFPRRSAALCVMDVFLQKTIGGGPAFMVKRKEENPGRRLSAIALL